MKWNEKRNEKQNGMEEKWNGSWRKLHRAYALLIALSHTNLNAHNVLMTLDAAPKIKSTQFLSLIQPFFAGEEASSHQS